WLPLVVLTLVQSVLVGNGAWRSFAWEVGVHARYLIAAPLLVLAESMCAPHLNDIVGHFTESGLVPDRERKRFDAAVDSRRGLLSSDAAEAVVIVAAYMLVTVAIYNHPAADVPLWAKTTGAAPGFSPAGWWHMLLSLPLLLILFFGWLWRV